MDALTLVGDGVEVVAALASVSRRTRRASCMGNASSERNLRGSIST